MSKDEALDKKAEPTTTKNNGGKTGWPPGLLQDDCKGLSKWLSNKPDAKRRVREAQNMAEQPAYRAVKTVHEGKPVYVAEQPAQQEPLTDIYRSFEQWKSGNVLERGVPRTEYYSEAQLDLVEMGWNYGYDAGRAVEQALDKKAENARELGLDYEPAQQEPVAWMFTDKEGTEFFERREKWEGKWTPLYTSPPAQQEPVLQEIEQYRLQMAGISAAAMGYWKESDGIHPDYDTIALRDVAKLYAKYDELYRAQRTWAGLTDVEWMNIVNKDQAWFGQRPDEVAHEVAKLVEARLKEKNNG